MRYSTIISVAAFVGISTVQASIMDKRATVDGPCTGANSAPGVCISTAKCSAAGGTSISNACPGTPDDIRCCTKTSCGSGGNCRWANQCSTGTMANQCPGPASFQCCVPKPGTNPNPGYPTPSIPPVGACRKPAVDGAARIVKAFPGQIREIGCIRNCGCSGGSSDHCCGMANDLMCSSAYGVRTDTGKPIAEWIMNNRAALKLKYVIWGQRIWSPSKDSVQPWEQWRSQGDRGSITENHWDHVHVSYNS